MHFMSRRLPRLLLAVLLSSAAGALTGCGEESGSRTGEASSRPGAPSRTLGEASQDAPADAGRVPGENLSKVVIKIRDEEKGDVLPGVMVQLFFTLPSKPDRISYTNGKTNLDGEAEFEIPMPERLMARSEYDLENRILEPSSSGETHATFSVRTAYEVSGRVTGPKGEGIQGAVVFLASLDSARNLAEAGMPLPETNLALREFRRRFGYDMKGEAETGEDGRFTARIKSCRPLIASACVQGLLCPNWIQVPFSLEKKRYESAEIRLRPIARLNITLYDAKNRGLPDQLVKLLETPCSRIRRLDGEKIHGAFTALLTSGPGGRVETAVPAGMEYTVEDRVLFPAPTKGADLPDPLRDRPLDGITVPPGESLDLAALPLRSVRLHGVIRDEQGEPVPGAVVSLPVNTIKTREIVEESGIRDNFSLLIPYNVHWGMSYEISMPGYKKIRGNLSEFELTEMTIGLDVRMERNVDLTVITAPDVSTVWLVRPPDPALQPVASVKGCERLMDTGSLLKGRRRTANAFFFQGIDPGPAALLAQRGSFGFIRIDEISVEDSGEHAKQLDLSSSTSPEAFGVLEETSLSGMVKAPEGMRPHRIDVTLMRTDLMEVRPWDPLALGKTRFGWERSRADRNGGFAFQGLSPGRYTLAAALHEWDARIDAYQELHIEPGANHVELDARNAAELGSVSIKILDSRSKPVAGVGLFLLDPVDSPLGRAAGPDYLSFSNIEGIIELDSLPPGRYGFSLSRPEGEGYLLDARVKVEFGKCSFVEIVLK